jgi:hypothetical protein
MSPDVQPSEAEFLSMSDEEASALVSPRRLSVSLLLNGTRRLFMATRFTAPPEDLGFLPELLEFIQRGMGELLTLLARHGVHRVFLPAYSEDQHERHERAHAYLVRGIELLTSHPALVAAYQSGGYGVRFYGDVANLPAAARPGVRAVDFAPDGPPRRFVHYGIDGGDPHRYLLQLAYELGQSLGRAPTRQELVARYYGEPDVEPIDFLVAFNRIYARLGIPPYLDGRDRVYATAVSPLALTRTMLRRVLYDYLYNAQDRGRDYLDLSDRQLARLKSFYAANGETVVGLTRSIEGLCYVLPSVAWPEDM